MADLFAATYARVKTVLEASTSFKALVPSGNFRPDFDIGAAQSGNVVYYGWSQAAFDARAKRAEGVFSVTVASIDGKAKAMQIMELLRGLLTAKNLSDNATVCMKLWREQPGTNDGGIDALQRNTLTASFTARLCAGPLSA